MDKNLKKDLKIRHTMISIGGVIGAGLFVGSGAVVHSASGSIVSYALAGLLVIFVMRMLGEMALLIRQVVHLQRMQEKRFWRVIQ